MVRLTELLKSRNRRNKEENGRCYAEKKHIHGSDKTRALFLQAGDISPLSETFAESNAVSRKGEIKMNQESGSSLSIHIPDKQTVASNTTESRMPSAVIEHDRDTKTGAIDFSDASDSVNEYPAWLRNESIIADTVYIEMIDLLDELYGARNGERNRFLEKFILRTEKLIEVCQRSNVIVRKAVRLKKEHDLLTIHSMNTAILAIKIGIVRNFTRERLFSLAISALLHDIGMIMVDASILDKKEKLTSEEYEQITQHVIYSREILSSEFACFPFLAPIAAQIHERENGGGYPYGLKGENIHEFAKIIGLCDVYIAMTSRKAHREDFSGYATLQQIISRRGIDFSPNIIKSLIDVLSVFPLESLVKLNNNAIGRVIDISSVHPTRPILLILINPDGERLKTPKYLDLEQEPLLYVETPDIEEGVVL